MISFLLRVVLVFLLVFWSVDFLIVNVEERVYEDMVGPAVRGVAVSTGLLVESRLAGLRDDALRHELQILEGELGCPVRLVTQDEALRVEDEFLVPVMLDHGDLAVIMGPLEPPEFLDEDEGIGGVSPVLPGVLLIVSIGGLVLVFPLARRVRTYDKAMEMIASGDLTVRVPEGSGGLLGQLENRINIMVGRIQDLVTGQKQLLQAVAHELRTPAARMRFGLDLLTEAEDPTERGRLIESLDQDLSELDDLLTELMEMVRLEGGRDVAEEPVDGLELARTLLTRFGQQVPDIQWDLSVADSFPDGVVLMTDPRLLSRALGNLLRNAFRHAGCRTFTGHRRHGTGIAHRPTGGQESGRRYQRRGQPPGRSAIHAGAAHPQG